MSEFKDSFSMKLCLSPWLAALTVFFIICARESLAAKPDPDVAAFIAAKRKQTETTARELEVRLPDEVTKMFDAAGSGDWQSTSNLFSKIITKYKPEEYSSARGRLAPEVWYAVQEVGGFCEFLAFRDTKFIRLFAEDTFKLIPEGSVYFGGTDPGRFIITALSRSHTKGEPFFTITQNQLVATNYLEYLRRMYGAQLKLPGREVTKKAMEDYSADLQRRWKHDQDFPNEPRQLDQGEQVRVVNNRLQAEGPTAVMAEKVGVAPSSHLMDLLSSKASWTESSRVLASLNDHPRPSAVSQIPSDATKAATRSAAFKGSISRQR